MKVLSVCETCLQTYYLDENEVCIPSNMRIRRARSRNPYIANWSDWIAHIQSHCPTCRVSCPEQALEDLQTHQKALEQDKIELTKDDDDYDFDEE